MRKWIKSTIYLLSHHFLFPSILWISIVKTKLCPRRRTPDPENTTPNPGSPPDPGITAPKPGNTITDSGSATPPPPPPPPLVKPRQFLWLLHTLSYRHIIMYKKAQGEYIFFISKG